MSISGYVGNWLVLKPTAEYRIVVTMVFSTNIFFKCGQVGVPVKYGKQFPMRGRERGYGSSWKFGNESVKWWLYRPPCP